VGGVFPRGDPYTLVWAQSKGKDLERGSDECQDNDNMAMSAMFAMMKTYWHAERCYGKLTAMLCRTRDDGRQLQREHDIEIERPNEELV
jgi:hypothetical protein